MKKKIYVASSWRNEAQESLVKELRLLGYDVYDFKHPDDGKPGFKWSEIDENWQNWSMEQYREALEDDYAKFGFNRDFDAMKEADMCVLCLPCGRSAHLEAGWMKGAGKRVIAFIPPGVSIEPELMYGLLDGIALSIQDVTMNLNHLNEFTISAPSEQTELDFEKEYKSYMKSRKDDLSGNAVTVNMKDLALYFWNKGLNTRKEE